MGIVQSKSPHLPDGSAEFPYDEFIELRTNEICGTATLWRSQHDEMIYLVIPHDRPGIRSGATGFLHLDGVIRIEADGSAKVIKDRGGVLRSFYAASTETSAVRRIIEEKQHLADMLEQIEALKRLWSDTAGLDLKTLLGKGYAKLGDDLSLRSFHEGLLFVLIAQIGSQERVRSIKNSLTDRQREIEAFLAGN